MFSYKTINSRNQWLGNMKLENQATTVYEATQDDQQMWKWNSMFQ